MWTHYVGEAGGSARRYLIILLATHSHKVVVLKHPEPLLGSMVAV